MDKQSNTYTVIYASVMVIVVAAVLAFTSLSLKEPQTRNIEIDKMKQILNSVRITSDASDAQQKYKKYITESFVINEVGEVIKGEDAFEVKISEQVKLPANKRMLPVFVAKLDNGSLKYIIPLYGAGLWGPLWGYLSVDSDGKTVYGAFFAHQGETPGLGAEIETPGFCDQFDGKRLFIDGTFKPIIVEKSGQKPIDGADYVDAISGGTITSKGVEAMIKNALTPYVKFLESLQTK
ncbi:MAG: NADH:ubiquinone reductase (Na(+)-transporting) subunit C [Bacteroidales bacterium]